MSAVSSYCTCCYYDTRTTLRVEFKKFVIQILDAGKLGRQIGEFTLVRRNLAKPG